jgi:hypothetical protein
MSRGRQKLVIDKEKLQSVINELESKQSFTKIGDLFKAVANTDWAKNLSPRPLTDQVARLRFKEFDLECKTKKARKGKGVVSSAKEKEVEVDESVKENSKLAAVVGARRVTRIPSGECPVKLKSTDKEAVFEWIEKVQEHYAPDKVISPEGLAYFVNYNFYSSTDNGYEEVCKHIREWTNETLGALSAEDSESF